MKDTKNLIDQEIIQIKNNVRGTNFCLALCVIFGLSMYICIECSSLRSESLSDALIFFFILFFGLGGGFLIFWLPRGRRFLRRDLHRGIKEVNTTTIDRISKLGIYESDDQSITTMMAGAVYYLWVKDADGKNGLRKFRIALPVYKALQKRSNDNITIGYLPRANIVLSVDTDTLHWRSYDKQPDFAEQILKDREASSKDKTPPS